MKLLTGESLDRMKKVYLAFLIDPVPRGPLAVARDCKLERDQINYLIRTFPEYWNGDGNTGYSLSGSGEMFLAANVNGSVKVYTPEDIHETGQAMAEHNAVAAKAGIKITAPEPEVETLTLELPMTWKAIMIHIANNVEVLLDSLDGKGTSLKYYKEGDDSHNAATFMKLTIQTIAHMKGVL